MIEIIAEDQQRIYSPPKEFLLPENAEPSKEVFGEWLVRSDSFPCLQDLPHRAGYPCFYLVSNGESIQFVCVIRWGRKKFRIQIEGRPCSSFASALTDVCHKAATIPELEDINWKDALSAVRPDLPIGSVSFVNLVHVGKPQFVCTFHTPGGIWCSSMPHATMRAAFDALVGCVEAPPPPHPPKIKASVILAELQGQLQTLVETPLTLNGSESALGDATKSCGLRANWLDVDDTRRKASTEGHYDTLAAAMCEMETAIQNTLQEGPRHPKPPICRELGVLAEDVLVEYRGSTRPICRIKVRGLGEVESNASAHRTAAYSDALKLIVKLATKRKDSPAATARDEPSAAMMAGWLAEAKKRWLEEREFLMGLTPVNEIDRRRLQQLSLFLAFLEPLRKYELAPGQRGLLAAEMVEEISQALLRQKPELFKANMAGYLRLLGRCVYCDPGHRVNLDQRFFRQSLLLRDSPKDVLEQLLTNRLLRKEHDGFAISTLGANLMEQALRDGFGKPTALGAALPTDILQGLAVLRERLAGGK